MLAVATFQIRIGQKYDSALTKATPGSSLTVWTQPSHTQTALMTGGENITSYLAGSDKLMLCSDSWYAWYQRIVATSDMMKGVSPGSAQVFDFMEAHGLSQSWVRTGFAPLGLLLSSTTGLNIKQKDLKRLSYCWVYSSVWSAHVSLTGPGSERSLSSWGQAPVKKDQGCSLTADTHCF